MKKENAITLISLVITIIILIILAGITINILLGENGLLQKTKTATQEYKYQAVKEKVESEILALDIDKVTKGETLTIEQALIGVQEAGVFEEIDLESNTGICEGYVIELGYNENGKVVIKGIEKDTGTRIIAKLNPTGYTKNNVEVTILARTNGKNVTSIEVPEGMREKGSGVYEIEKNGTYLVKVSLEDGQILEKEITIATIDRLAPKDFEPTIEREGNKIIITPNGEDDEDEENVKSGINYYEYYLNDMKQESNEITGLTEGTYKVHVIAYDKAGNQKKSKEIEVEYIMKAPEITLSNEEWTNQNIIATVDWGETVPTDKKEISIDGGVTYTPYVNSVEIDRNTIIKAKLISGTIELIGEKEVRNIDKLAPNEFTPKVNDLESNTELTISANVTDQEETEEYGKSQIGTYQYFVYEGENLIDSSEVINNSTWKASKLTVGKTYNIYVDAYDKAGNKTSEKIESYTKLPVYVWNIYLKDSSKQYIYSTNTGTNMRAKRRKLLS